MRAVYQRAGFTVDVASTFGQLLAALPFTPQLGAYLQQWDRMLNASLMTADARLRAAKDSDARSIFEAQIATTMD